MITEHSEPQGYRAISTNLLDPAQADSYRRGVHLSFSTRSVAGMCVAALMIAAFAQRPFGQAPPPGGTCGFATWARRAPDASRRSSAFPATPPPIYAGAASGGVWKTTDGCENLRADLRRSAGPRRSARSRWPPPTADRVGRHRRSVDDS